jgi:uncharacterized protein YndB with AHSA1/START domain
MTRKTLISTFALSMAITAPGCGGDDGPAGMDSDDEGTTGDVDPNEPTTHSPGSESSPGNDTAEEETTDGTGGEETSDGSTDDGSADETGEPVDVEPPTILSISPEDGETGVLPDAPIVVTFSEPMDKAATQGAYQSADIPSGDVTMSWNFVGDVLTITPNDPLEMGHGVDPNTVTALAYQFAINPSARDLAGNELEAETEVEFFTARRILHTQPVLGPSTGFVRADGSTNTGYIMVGDSGSPPNAQYKGFFSFALSDLPEDIVTFQSAELRVHQYNVHGTPYADLGDMFAYDVEFTGLNLAAFNAAPIAEIGVLSNSASNGWKILDVTAFLAEDYAAERETTQFRVEFPIATNFDGSVDAAYLATTSGNPAVMTTWYLIP